MKRGIEWTSLNLRGNSSNQWCSSDKGAVSNWTSLKMDKPSFAFTPKPGCGYVHALAARTSQETLA
jgi:hypothetical protein